MTTTNLPEAATGIVGSSVPLHSVVLETRPDLTPPFDDPVIIFGLAMIVFLTAPLILQRYRLPGVVGIILVGALLGENVAGLLERDDTIQLLGEVGLIYLMFIAGLEINLNQFLEYKDRSIVFGGLSFLIPQVVGTIVGYYALELSFPAALLFAAIFSSHTLLAYPVVSRLGIAKNEAMTATIGGTILTDTLALLVLAIVIAADGGSLDGAFWVEFTLGLAVFFVGVWLIVPRLGQWFFRIHDEESYFEFLFVMAVLFACAFLAEMAQVEHIIGAFLAGLALNRLIPESGPLMNRIEFVGNALFIPFFLLSVGMQVDPSALSEGTDTLVLAGSLIVLVIATKYVSSVLTAKVYGFDRTQVLGMFGLSVGQAAAALAIVQIGVENGIPGFDQHMINGVVLMILVASVLSPALVERAGVRLIRANERSEYDPSDTPQRVLVPVSRQSEYRESLLDLSFVVREERSEQPLHVLSVVQPDGGSDAEAAVADAENLHEEMVEYASGAEVPVETHTRVNHNIASGIVRSTVENRISTVVIGWDGAASRGQHVFGHIIDQVLARTDQLTLVGRVREPINTTRSIHLILPPGIDHNDGFYEALHTIKGLAEQTGAPIRGLVVDGNPEQFERLSALVEPETQTTFEAVEDWKTVVRKLDDDVRPDDLVVCTSARRNDAGWHSELRTLPKSISTVTEGNFAIVYPATKERVDDRRFLQISR